MTALRPATASRRRPIEEVLDHALQTSHHKKRILRSFRQLCRKLQCQPPMPRFF